jgi:hypothetical protein
VALRQDGVFTRSQARAAGWGARSQRRLLGGGLWVPLAGTVLRHREVEVGPWQRAWAVHLTAGLVVSHATAGALWQFVVPEELHGIGHVERTPARVRAHRIPFAEEDGVRARGLVLTSPTRTLTDLLCSLGEEAGVAMLTDAFRRRLCTLDDVRAAVMAAHGRHGVTLARHLAHSCRHEPHSPLEWRFHGLCAALGPGWRFNVDLGDDLGFIGRVDALHTATWTVVELDGQRFHGEERFQADRTRDQRLVALGFVVLRVTWSDLEQRPMDVVERIGRTLAVRASLGRAPTPGSARPPGGLLAM